MLWVHHSFGPKNQYVVCWSYTATDIMIQLLGWGGGKAVGPNILQVVQHQQDMWVMDLDQYLERMSITTTVIGIWFLIWFVICLTPALPRALLCGCFTFPDRPEFAISPHFWAFLVGGDLSNDPKICLKWPLFDHFWAYFDSFLARFGVFWAYFGVFW